MKIDGTVHFHTCIPYNSTPVNYLFFCLSHLMSCHQKRGFDVYFHYGLISLLTIAHNFMKLDIHLIHHKPDNLFFFFFLFLANYNVMEKGGLMGLSLWTNNKKTMCTCKTQYLFKYVSIQCGF